VSTDAIIEELKKATDNLLFMSESDYPFEVLTWAGSTEITPEYLRQVAGAPANTAVETRSVEDMFRAAVKEYDSQPPEAKQTASRYKELVSLLKTRLTGAKAYRIGRIKIAAYVVGRAPDGTWVGIRTKIVET
jgi:hypothetical protein